MCSTQSPGCDILCDISLWLIKTPCSAQTFLHFSHETTHATPQQYDTAQQYDTTLHCSKIQHHIIKDHLQLGLFQLCRNPLELCDFFAVSFALDPKKIGQKKENQQSWRCQKFSGNRIVKKWKPKNIFVLRSKNYLGS